MINWTSPMGDWEWTRIGREYMDDKTIQLKRSGTRIQPFKLYGKHEEQPMTLGLLHDPNLAAMAAIGGDVSVQSHSL